jgi:uncharacterized protein (TIGR02466 family)
MPIEAFFPIPLYKYQLERNDYDPVQQELTVMYQAQLATMQKNPDWDVNTHMLTDPTFNCNVLKQYNCTAFTDVLTRSIRDYLTSLGTAQVEYSIINSWCTLTRQGEYAKLHDHSTADLSGVYYLKTTGHDGHLYFTNPHSELSHSWAFRDTPKIMGVEPVQGQLMLWPGFLWHGTGKNTTNRDRVSISFNIGLKRPW